MFGRSQVYLCPMRIRDTLLNLKASAPAGVVALCCLLLACPAHAGEAYRYTLGAGFAPQTLSGGDAGSSQLSPRFVISPGFTANLSRTLKPKLSARIDYLYGKIYSDSGATSIFQIGSATGSRITGFQSHRVTLALQYFLRPQQAGFAPYIGAGPGIDFWKFVDPVSGAPIDTLSDKNTPKTFKAEELLFTSFAGFNLSLGKQFSFGFEGRVDYHTGPGADFADIVNSSRPRWALTAVSRLQMSFGLLTKREHWNEEKSWSQSATTYPSHKPTGAPRDSDGDGVADDRDKCPGTVSGAIVNSLGCPMDSDGDGVLDGLDDCPDTPPGALGAVDIYGCPIDSDFDGIPDFMDSCPSGAIGAHVDEKGCAIDSDGDGVADGLDDCPQTAAGLKVDERGCVDVSVFAQAMVLNISYESGSFEIDRKNKGVLRQLALMLQEASDINLEIIGYTDNIGSAKANRALSEKRARRVYDYLKSLGISPKRMTVRGRGETNFIADNATASGRQKNRRIEILFQRK